MVIDCSSFERYYGRHAVLNPLGEASRSDSLDDEDDWEDEGGSHDEEDADEDPAALDIQTLQIEARQARQKIPAGDKKAEDRRPTAPNLASVDWADSNQRPHLSLKSTTLSAALMSRASASRQKNGVSLSSVFLNALAHPAQLPLMSTTLKTLPGTPAPSTNSSSPTTTSASSGHSSTRSFP